MKTRFTTLAIAALSLWLIPSVGLAQGNSGRSRLTICHIPPGNPDSKHTLTIAESAWSAHESHGDFLGPCDEYGDDHGGKYKADDKRAKKSKQRKGRKEQRSGSNRGDAEDEIGDGGRADQDPEVGETGSEPDQTDSEEADRRKRRHAERRDRERSIRDRTDPRSQDGQAAEASASEDASEAASGDAPPAEGRTGRKARDARRNQRGTQPGVEADAAPAEDPGFFGDMRRFFGLGADEAKPPSGDEPSGDAVE